MSFIKFGEDIDGKSFYIVRKDDWYEVNKKGVCINVSGFKGYDADFYIFEDEEAAGEYAREYWADYIEDDPDTAVEILGKENLIAWALGRLAGPGYTKVRSLTEWLDLYLETPEEHFEEGPFDISAIGENIVESLGFRPTVAYHCG